MDQGGHRGAPVVLPSVALVIARLCFTDGFARLVCVGHVPVRGRRRVQRHVVFGHDLDKVTRAL
eukprot:11883736-Alexandrium_andersonii.AAC.1